MKTKDLYLNSVMSTGNITNAVVKSILFTVAITLLFSIILLVGFAVFTIISMIFTFIATNLIGILLAVGLIAVLKKVVLR